MNIMSTYQHYSIFKSYDWFRLDYVEDWHTEISFFYKSVYKFFVGHLHQCTSFCGGCTSFSWVFWKCLKNNLDCHMVLNAFSLSHLYLILKFQSVSGVTFALDQYEILIFIFIVIICNNVWMTEYNCWKVWYFSLDISRYLITNGIMVLFFINTLDYSSKNK